MKNAPNRGAYTPCEGGTIGNRNTLCSELSPVKDEIPSGPIPAANCKNQITYRTSKRDHLHGSLHNFHFHNKVLTRIKDLGGFGVFHSYVMGTVPASCGTPRLNRRF